MGGEQLSSSEISGTEDSTRGTQVRHELDWGKLPYPLWLRNWLDKLMAEIQQDKSIRNSDAKARAKEAISQEFAQSGIPLEFLPIPELDSLEIGEGKPLAEDEI